MAYHWKSPESIAPGFARLRSRFEEYTSRNIPFRKFLANEKDTFFASEIHIEV